jgi:DNA primase
MSWLDILVEFAQSQIDDRVREELWARGVSNEQIERFQIGYLNKDLPEGLSEGFVEWSSRGSKLADVFVLPLTTATGTIAGIQFRAVDRARKGYMDYLVDHTQAVLFGLAQAMPAVWETETVWLVEGGFDLFPIQRVFPNTVSTLTARVPETFLRLMRRLVKRVNLVYDRDATGRRGSENFIRFHGEEFERVNDFLLPPVRNAKNELVKDPNELWEVWGDKKFESHFRCIRNETEL